MEAKRVFRPVREEEHETIGEIAAAAWEPIYERRREIMGDAFFERYHGDWRSRKAGEVIRAARTRPGMVWVTEIDGEVVAFTTFRIDEDRGVGEICNNAVRPEWRGRGIGTQQHREVLRMFRERGLTHATVGTGLDEAHAPARATYEKLGFRPMVESVVYFMEL
jgi:ribosomal protein S18 acetylase RimI-like enzyme